MKSPKPKEVIRFYRQYGIPDIFTAVTRKKSARQRLFLDAKELVEKRNLIAHGDASTEALPGDVTRYLWAVEKFARSADGVLSRAIKRIIKGATAPW
jgi:hypothetical protein